MSRRLASAAGALILLAGCGEVPQPFRHEGINRLAAPAAPRGVTVRQVEGVPFAPALAEAMTKRLLDADVPATSREAAGAYLIEGALGAEKGAYAIDWRLKAPDDQVPARFSQKIPVDAWMAADSRLVGALAAEAVTMLSGPLHGELSAAELAARPRPTVRLVPPSGLPGDGDQALAAAMRRVLEGSGLVVQGGDGDYIVTGKATLAAGRPGEQALEVAWAVTTSTGAELGVAAQQGAVPKGRLDGAWGPLAEDIAAGGAEGVLQIVRAATDK
jgi:hypothetical protein